MLFKRQLEESTRYKRVNILDFDKLTALECIICRYGGPPLAKQEVRKRKHSDFERCSYSSEREQESFDLSVGCGTTHSLSAHHLCSSAVSCTTHQVVFRFFVALPFSHSILLIVEIEELRRKQSNPCGVEKHIRSSSTARILTVHFCTRDHHRCD